MHLFFSVRGAAASSLAYLTPNQTLASLPGAFVGVDGVAHFDKLGVKALGSDMDCKGHTLSNVEVCAYDLSFLLSVLKKNLFLAVFFVASVVIVHSLKFLLEFYISCACVSLSIFVRCFHCERTISFLFFV